MGSLVIARQKHGVLAILTGLLITVVIGVLGAPIATGQAVADPANLEELLERLTASLALPPEMGFKQNIEARALLGRWRFTSVVVSDAKGISVQAEGAPVFVPEKLLADLADFEKAMSGFDLKYEGRTMYEKEPCLLISGNRRPGLTSGARQGSIYINPDSYEITRLEAQYDWGRVAVDQYYTQQGEYTVLKRQEATIWPLYVNLTIEYSDYWFE